MRYKSKLACEWSAKQIADKCNLGRLWTFTLPDCISINQAAARWKALLREIRHRGLPFAGVRCWELHPNGHGIHVHFINLHYCPKESIESCCLKTGWGFVNVKAIPPDYSYYVSKYVAKARRSEALRGRRLWSWVGKDGREFHVKAKDIQYTSPDLLKARAWALNTGLPVIDCLRAIEAFQMWSGAAQRITEAYPNPGATADGDGAALCGSSPAAVALGLVTSEQWDIKSHPIHDHPPRYARQIWQVEQIIAKHNPVLERVGHVNL